MHSEKPLHDHHKQRASSFYLNMGSLSAFLARVSVIGSSGLGSTSFSVVGIMVESQWFSVALFLGHADAADHSASSCSPWLLPRRFIWEQMTKLRAI